jgi:hypothetical protein
VRKARRAFTTPTDLRLETPRCAEKITPHNAAPTQAVIVVGDDDKRVEIWVNGNACHRRCLTANNEF